jgi:hypothetical protein
MNRQCGGTAFVCQNALGSMDFNEKTTKNAVYHTKGTASLAGHQQKHSLPIL